MKSRTSVLLRFEWVRFEWVQPSCEDVTGRVRGGISGTSGKDVGGNWRIWAQQNSPPNCLPHAETFQFTFPLSWPE